MGDNKDILKLFGVVLSICAGVYCSLQINLKGEGFAEGFNSGSYFVLTILYMKVCLSIIKSFPAFKKQL